ncbi:MAG: hypothetical protein ACYTGL_24235, partial [Planctomycetota bacterium]
MYSGFNVMPFCTAKGDIGLIHQRELVGEQQHLSQFLPWAEWFEGAVGTGEICAGVPAHRDAGHRRGVAVGHRDGWLPVELVVDGIGAGGGDEVDGLALSHAD